MSLTRVVTALTTRLVVLATASLFAVTSGCGAVWRAAAVHPRRVGVIAALVVVAGAAWMLLSALAAAAVPLLFGAAAAVRTDDLAEYLAASDRARSPEPPWWPQFEYEFRRECRRRERARRRALHLRRLSHGRTSRHDRRQGE